MLVVFLPEVGMALRREGCVVNGQRTRASERSVPPVALAGLPPFLSFRRCHPWTSVEHVVFPRHPCLLVWTKIATLGGEHECRLPQGVDRAERVQSALLWGRSRGWCDTRAEPCRGM